MTNKYTKTLWLYALIYSITINQVVVNSIEIKNYATVSTLEPQRGNAEKMEQ